MIKFQALELGDAELFYLPCTLETALSCPLWHVVTVVAIADAISRPWGLKHGRGAWRLDWRRGELWPLAWLAVRPTVRASMTPSSSDLIHNLLYQITHEHLPLSIALTDCREHVD